jgi:hypothetical protein
MREETSINKAVARKLSGIYDKYSKNIFKNMENENKNGRRKYIHYNRHDGFHEILESCGFKVEKFPEMTENKYVISWKNDIPFIEYKTVNVLTKILKVIIKECIKGNDHVIIKNLDEISINNLLKLNFNVDKCTNGNSFITW